MFKLYCSNRLEELARILAGTLESKADDSSGFFSQAAIVAQSRGMMRYLNLQLAGSHGIAANYRYFLPENIINELFSCFLPQQNPCEAFKREKMMWLIAGILPDMIDDDDFKILRAYLTASSGKEQKIKLLQLARHIAKVFDQYMMFRPQMLCGAEHFWRSESCQSVHWRWQYKLFKAIERKAGSSNHPARLRSSLLKKLRDMSPREFAGHSGLRKLAVFGIVQLPDFYLDILTELGRFINIDFFYLCPSREYFGDIDSPKKHAQMERDALAAYSDCPNRLFASLGRAKIEFFELLNEKNISNSSENFLTAADDTVLGSIQNNILNLEDNPLTGILNISVNSCAGIRREVEVLNDYLLDVLASGDVKVEEIVVMTPDIHKYSSFIEAVFDNCESPERKIAYSIADRKGGSKNSLVNALLDIINIDSCRYSLLALENLLDHDIIRECFDLSASESRRVFELLRAAAACWGIDGKYREDVSKVDFSESSLRRATAKLMLGYSFGTDKIHEQRINLYENTMALDISLRPDDAQSLAKFSVFAESLYALHEQNILAGEKDPAQWAAFISKVMDDFLDNDDLKYSAEKTALRDFIRELSEVHHQRLFRARLPLEVITEQLQSKILQQRASAAYLRHGVTFCELLPMRSIPFKVVCLLGMDDSLFPRRQIKDNFDLTAANHRRGDRDQALEDKSLFLDALLSSREALYISYNGIDENTAGPLPAAPPVTELLDYITTLSNIEYEQLVRIHPLQGFSREYFNGSSKNLYSYSVQNLEAAKSLNSRRQKKAPQPLDFDVRETRQIDIEELAAFFKNPVKYFLRQQLAVRTVDEPSCSELAEHENFSPGALDEYSIRKEIMLELLANNGSIDPLKLEQTTAFFRDKGLLPPAPNDRTITNKLYAECRELFKSVAAARDGREKCTDAIFSVGLEDINMTLRANIRDMYENGHIPYSVSSSKAKHQIKVWLEHLCLNTRCGTKSHAVFKNGVKSFDEMPQETAVAELTKLLKLYLRGQQTPLPFLPDFSAEICKREPEEFAKIAGKWQRKDNFSFRDFYFDDIFWQQCFPGNINDYADDFCNTANEFYETFKKYGGL